jgi:hypothetical protein
MGNNKHIAIRYKYPGISTDQYRMASSPCWVVAVTASFLTDRVTRYERWKTFLNLCWFRQSLKQITRWKLKIYKVLFLPPLCKCCVQLFRQLKADNYFFLFNDGIIYWDCLLVDNRTISEVQIGKDLWPWRNLRYYSAVRLKRLKKTIKFSVKIGVTEPKFEPRISQLCNMNPSTMIKLIPMFFPHHQT